MDTTVERKPLMCALCNGARPEAGSVLCVACADFIDWQEQRDNAIDNGPVCGDCGLMDCAHLLGVAG